MINLRFAETLREVAEHGSFSAAAQALHFTQPAVSRQVASLERDVGMPLVVRSRQGVHLTAAGQLVVEHAETIRAQALRLEDELALLAGEDRISASLGAFPSAFVGLVPAIVKALRDRVPHAAIRLRRCSHDEAISLVRKAELDVALVFARDDHRAKPAHVELVHLGDEPMLVLLPRGHVLADSDVIELRALQDEPWIVGARDPASSIVLTACRQAGFEPTISFESDDTIAVQSLVAAGFGVTLTSPWTAVALRDDIVLRQLAAPVPTRRIDAVVAAPTGSNARLLLDIARETAERIGVFSAKQRHTP
jgi:DNA-binding transcriptional LysR family regulator